MGASGHLAVVNNNWLTINWLTIGAQQIIGSQSSQKFLQPQNIFQVKDDHT